MKSNSVLLVAAMLTLTACFSDSPSPPAIRYARHKIEPPGTGVVFGYGQRIEFASCSVSACYGTIKGKAMRVPLADIQETAPLKGPFYVWDDESLDGQTLHALDDYQPAQSTFHLADVDRWIQTDSLRNRPETPADRETRRKAKEAEEVLRAQREKEQAVAQAQAAKEQAKMAKVEGEERRRAARQAFIAGEADRRAFARQLRDNYLSMGANIKVTVSGAHAERITLEYALIDDVWTYKFQHSEDTLSALRLKGFTHLTLSDGFDYGMRITL